VSSGLRIRNIGQLVTCDPARHALPDGPAGPAERALGIVPGAAIAIEGGRVSWVGPDSELPDGAGGQGARSLDATGKVVVPGLVDNHTHLVFAGDRVGEFALRCGGATYESIARAGGGIAVTARATRAASEDQLVELARPRLDRLLRWGVTTVEIKSGYGLDVESELKMLRVVRRLQAERSQTLVPTFLGAHVVPPEHRANRSRYVDSVVCEMLPEVARQGLAEYCDVFCETTAFSVPETERILETAAALGLGLRVHAEQLHHTGGAALAARLGAASADHLEWIDDDDVQALASSGTVATLLPGATLFLGQDRWPPARRLLDAGLPVALATDCNPGSCMTENLPLMGTLGCVRMGMAPHEALLAMTAHPARSLGRAGQVGCLVPGAVAHAVWFDLERYEAMLYHFATPHARGVVAGGRVAFWEDGAAWRV
jgi:imidazolonepropionase